MGETEEVIRRNIPACPRCGRSQIDMPKVCFEYDFTRWSARLRCDACGFGSTWVETGFMVMAPRVKEYQSDLLLHRP